MPLNYRQSNKQLQNTSHLSHPDLYRFPSINISVMIMQLKTIDHFLNEKFKKSSVWFCKSYSTKLREFTSEN